MDHFQGTMLKILGSFFVDVGLFYLLGLGFPMATGQACSHGIPSFPRATGRLQDLHAQLSGVPGSGFLAGGRGNPWFGPCCPWGLTRTVGVGWLVEFFSTQICCWEFELNFWDLRLLKPVVKKGRWMIQDSVLVDRSFINQQCLNGMGLRFLFGVARENEINEAGRWLLHATGRGWASVISFGQWTYLKCLLVVFIYLSK